MKLINIEIPMKCPPMPRPRVGGKGKKRYVYVPWKTVHDTFRTLLSDAIPEGHKLIENSCIVTIVYTKATTSITIMELPFNEKEKRADIDNMNKMVLDTLQGRVIKNDIQVYGITSHYVSEAMASMHDENIERLGEVFD